LKAIVPCLIAISASLIWASAARAQAPNVQLIWERPPGSFCPSRAVLEADVEAVMGRRVFGSAEDARVIVHGEVRDLSSGVRVRLEARTRDGTLLGTRELSAEAGQCASLRGAIGLVLTLLVDHEDAWLEQSDHDGVRFAVGAVVSLQSIPLPRATVSAGPTLAVELGRAMRLQADFAYWVPVTIQTVRGVGAKLEAFTLALRACGRFWGERTSFGLSICVGAEGGPLIATPRNLEGPERQVRMLAHGLLELRWEARLAADAALELAVGPLLSFSRPSFSYVRADGATMPVYRPQLGGIIFQVAFIILGS
jgi:hypothetical protein